MSGRSRDLVRANAPMIPGAKIQPQAKELEEVVLGAMMVEKSAVNAVIDVLQPESFYVEAHGEDRKSPNLVCRLLLEKKKLR